MATILAFNTSARGAGAGRRGQPAQPAEIVFFPGIRYERWGDSPDAARGRRVRDRIELGE